MPYLVTHTRAWNESICSLDSLSIWLLCLMLTCFHVSQPNKKMQTCLSLILYKAFFIMKTIPVNHKQVKLISRALISWCVIGLLYGRVTCVNSRYCCQSCLKAHKHPFEHTPQIKTCIRIPRILFKLFNYLIFYKVKGAGVAHCLDIRYIQMIHRKVLRKNFELPQHYKLPESKEWHKGWWWTLTRENNKAGEPTCMRARTKSRAFFQNRRIWAASNGLRWQISQGFSKSAVRCMGGSYTSLQLGELPLYI